MPNYFSLAAKILIAVLMLTGPAPGSHAYVLEGPHILDLTVRSIGSARTLLVSQRVCIFNDEEAPDIPGSESETPEYVEYEEVTGYGIPDHFRSDIETAQGAKTYFFSLGHRYLTVINETITSRNEPLLSRYKDVLLIRDRDLLENHLVQRGIDTSISSLGRFNGNVHYVIGAKYPDESLPQLWVDQKTFRPSRYIIPDTDNPGIFHHVEIVYLDWKRFGRIWHPERIEIYKGGTILQTLEPENVSVNPVFEEDMFDIDKALLLYKNNVAAESNVEDTQDELNRVRQSIEEFRKRFEQ